MSDYDNMMKRLTVEIDEDGYVEGHEVCTTAGIPKFVENPKQFEPRYDPVNRFVAFEIDNGPEDIEVRIPFEWMLWFAARIRELESEVERMKAEQPYVDFKVVNHE